MAIKNLSDIEKLLSLEAGSLKAAIENEEEVEVTVPKLIIRTEEEDRTLHDNFEKEKKDQYESGKEKGTKDLVNANIEKFGLDLTDKAKSFENFAEALQEKITSDLGKPKDELNEQLKTDNEKLRENYSVLENEFSTYKQNIKTENEKRAIDSEINSLLPSEGTVIPKEEMAIIFKNKYQPTFDEDNRLVFKQNGEVIKDDKTRNPKTGQQIMDEFTPSYMKKPTGTGGDDETGSSQKTSYDKWEQDLKNEGISPSSAEGQQRMHQAIKEGTLEV